MKKYNVKNYIRYKEDVKASQPDLKDLTGYERNELINKFLPLVENIARKFSTSQQASGVMSINDLIQEGSIGLIKSVDKLDYLTLESSEDQEKTLKSFFSKRIKGSIRRAVDINRGDIRIPEHKMNEIRKNPNDEKMVSMFFNSIFLSIDANPYEDDEDMTYQVPDNSEPYNIALMNSYLKGLMQKHLTENQYEVLRLSYGLDCDKHSAKEIATKLNIKGASDYVRVSELKKEAVQCLINLKNAWGGEYTKGLFNVPSFHIKEEGVFNHYKYHFNKGKGSKVTGNAFLQVALGDASNDIGSHMFRRIYAIIYHYQYLSLIHI